MKKNIISLLVIILIALVYSGHPIYAEHLNKEKLEEVKKSAVTVFVAHVDDIDYFIDKSMNSYVSYGSGFAFSQKYVLTAAHVVESAYQYPNERGIYLLDDSGSYYKADIYYYDRNQDLAILTTSKTSKIIELDASTPYVGEEVTTISSPTEKPKNKVINLIDIINLFHTENNCFITPDSIKGFKLWYGSSGGSVYSMTGYRGFIISYSVYNETQFFMTHSYQLKPVFDKLNIPYIEKKKGE